MNKKWGFKKYFHLILYSSLLKGMNIFCGLQTNILLHIKAAPVFILKWQIPLSILCLKTCLTLESIWERSEFSQEMKCPQQQFPQQQCPLVQSQDLKFLTSQHFQRIYGRPTGLKYCDWAGPWDSLALGTDQRRAISIFMERTRETPGGKFLHAEEESLLFKFFGIIARRTRRGFLGIPVVHHQQTQVWDLMLNTYFAFASASS